METDGGGEESELGEEEKGESPLVGGRAGKQAAVEVGEEPTSRHVEGREPAR